MASAGPCCLHTKPRIPVVKNRYSQLLFTSEDRFCANLIAEEQSMMWSHNASTSRLRDVIDQLWWGHNAKLEKIFFVDNVEMSGR